MTEEVKNTKIEVDGDVIDAFAKHVLTFEGVDNSDGLGAFRIIVMLQGLAQWMADSMGVPMPKMIDIGDKSQGPVQ